MGYFVIGGIISFAITLDILRYYYKYIATLLSPSMVINLIVNKAEKHIHEISRRAKKISKLGYEASKEEYKKTTSRKDIEIAYYKIVFKYMDIVKFWADELTEIAHKSIIRGESILASNTILALYRIAKSYLTIRKDNITLVQSEFLLDQKSDADKIMEHVCRSLEKINLYLVLSHDENIALNTVRIYVELMKITSKLKFCNNKSNVPPLITDLFYSLRRCIKKAQEKHCDEVVFQSTEVILQAIFNFTENLSIYNIYIPIIDWMNEISIYFFIQNKFPLSVVVINRILNISAHLVERKHPQHIILFSHILDLLEKSFVPYVLAYEKSHQDTYMISTIETPYVSGIRRIVEMAMPSNDENNPYFYFLQITTEIHKHFRRLAKIDNFKNSDFLLSDTMHTIKCIILIIFGFTRHPIRKGYEDDLINEVKWFLSFFWAVFSKKKEISYYWVKIACDMTADISLMFTDQEWFFNDMMVVCASNIQSIINSYCMSTNNITDYQIADLLLFIWYLRLIAQKKESCITTELDKKLTKKPESLTEEQWNVCLTFLEKEKDKLNKDIQRNRPEIISSSNTSRNLLIKLLNRKDLRMQQFSVAPSGETETAA